MTTTKDGLDQIIDVLAEELKPVVAHIEAKPLTTKDHYGDYISALSVIAERFKTLNDGIDLTHKVYIAVGVAFQRAGANKNGVQAALRAMGHI